jgi:hypothetical protein
LTAQLAARLTPSPCRNDGGGPGDRPRVALVHSRLD